MSTGFDDAVTAAVLAHMNGDHTDDNVLIARAFGPEADVVSATMTGLDSEAGTWSATGADGVVREVVVAWPSGPITQRPEIRREVVALYDEACRILDVPARPHG
ncbi:DUF2470 domain-containing protein [Microbacterium thalassium]|uniref:DUF2470 domain-containing protein n=1 Tax=Microbacterium thalassium TaxID=362649 RepID=A0A7X0FMU9_9MICO|nr:DUF2470 domain-containing protein [Microbacterium thalassium]MBB6390417.1 hypothetical protein [Microbacterium thalassium]GLK25526.1 hypothetical protein GCM10017607_28450 [Microbacterium thalassium]